MKSKPRSGGPRNYDPLPWSEYFDEYRDVLVTHDDYLSGSPPEGYPPFDKDMDPQQRGPGSTQQEGDTFRVYLAGYKDADNDSFNTPTLVLLHGGGYSALTWAVFTKEVRHLCRCNVLAIDLRGHGCTKTSDDEDLSAETLVKDVGAVIKGVHEGWSGLPPLVLVGHR